MKRQREQVREELLAVLAASRELTADHDEALADLILDRVAHPAQVRKPGARTRRHTDARHDGPIPVLVTLAIATFISLFGALESHASVVDFVLLWLLLAAMTAAVMQIGLCLVAFRASERQSRV